MVDTTLDKIIMEAIEISAEIVVPSVVNDENVVLKPAILLSDIPVFFIGDKNMINFTDQRIVFARTANKNNLEGFDFTERKLPFGFHIQCKNTKEGYLGVMDLINNIENALISTLKDEDGLLGDYNDTMSVDDITPIYLSEYDTMENITFFTEEVVVSFTVDEDYSQPDKVYDSIQVRSSEIKHD